MKAKIALLIFLFVVVPITTSAYVTINDHTWTTDELVTAAKLELYIDDNLSALDSGLDSIDATAMYKSAFGDSANAWLLRDTTIQLRGDFSDSADAWLARTPINVDSTDIPDGSISGADLRIDLIDSTKVRNGSLSGDDLRADLIDSTKVKDGTISGSDLVNPLRYNGGVYSNTALSVNIYTNTTDGTDNSYVAMTGGGSPVDGNRGGYIWITGNEHANAGKVYINGGAPSSWADVLIGYSGSKVVIGGNGPAVTALDINDNSFRLITAQSPASSAAGSAGEIAWDTNYLYICVATNTWKRAALTGSY